MAGLMTGVYVFPTDPNPEYEQRRAAYLSALEELVREKLTAAEIKNHVGKQAMGNWKHFQRRVRAKDPFGSETMALQLGVKREHITALQTLLGYRDG